MGLEDKRDGSHKNSDGRALREPSLERFRNIYQLSPNIVTTVANSTGRWDAKHAQLDHPWKTPQGGLLYQQVTDPKRYQDTITFNFDGVDMHFVATHAVKPDSWIFPHGRPLINKDIISLSTPERSEKEPYLPHVGSELELMCLHGRLATPETFETLSTTDRFASVIDPSVLDKLSKDGAKVTIEALKWTTEINNGHDSDVQKQSKADLRVMKTLTQEAKRLKKAFLPVSMFPHLLEESDLSMDDYAQGIVTKNPWENSKLYRPSHSLQITVENASLQEGRRAQNMWYQVTHLIKALTLDSTVAFGQVNPNMKTIIEKALNEGATLTTDQDYLQFIDYNTPLSTREAARLFGSRLGAGVINGPFPEAPEDYYGTVEKTMSHDETSPTPDRIGSIGNELHHGNMRYKRTIGKNSANEIAALDTIGGDPVKQTAIKELVRRLNILFNITDPRNLAKKAPKLFSSSLTKERCGNLQIDSLHVDNLGTEATVYDAQGRVTEASILINQLIELASQRISDKRRQIDIPEMSENLKKELLNSAKVPTENDFLNAQGTLKVNGVVIPSVSGWYGIQGDGVRGIGTPAHWRRARIKALQALGFSDTVIKTDYVIDGENAFHTRIMELEAEDIDQLYAGKQSAVPIFP